MSLLDRAFRRPSARHAEAAAVAHQGVWVYHRAGCPFCLRLTLGLGRRAREARWVDIWTDPDAAASPAPDGRVCLRVRSSAR